jgi:hypothetical protein
MTNDTEHSAFRTVAAQSSAAPFASAARKVDFSYDAAALQMGTVGLDNFSDEFMAWDSVETVVAAFQLEIRVADPCKQNTNQRETLRTPGFRHVANTYPPVLNVDG